MPAPTLNEWLDRLTGVVQRGAGFKAICPAHADKNPSLSVSEGDNGKVLVKCFAGCEFKDVRAAIGLDKGDEPRPSVPAQPRPAKPQTGQYPPAPLPKDGDGVTLHRYQDAGGKEAFVVVRRDQPGGGKTFSQRTPSAGGLYAYHGPAGSRHLYRLPTLAKADKVVVVEGRSASMPCSTHGPTRL